jgi:hypothetical protein
VRGMVRDVVVDKCLDKEVVVPITLLHAQLKLNVIERNSGKKASSHENRQKSDNEATHFIHNSNCAQRKTSASEIDHAAPKAWIHQLAST